MPDNLTPPTRLTTERREQTIQTLVAAFAQDRLTLEDLERRLDLAQRTTDVADLDELIADLPAPAAATAPAARPVASPDQVRDNQVVVAIMGGVEKKGRWTPARRTVVLAFMGGAVIDLREALLPPGETEIAVFTVWGGVEIIVAPGTDVDVSGVAIMAGFDQQPNPVPAPMTAPTVRVTGFAMMAGVEVMVRYPGESAKDARRRVKAEKRTRGELPAE